MTTKRITIKIDDQPVELVLRSATVDDGLLRGQLIGDSIEKFKNGSRVEQIAATVLHPTCICSIDQPEELRSMRLEDFRKLQELDVNTWLAAVYELNPHWKAKASDVLPLSPDESQKKMTAPTSGSEASTSAAKIPQPTSPTPPRDILTSTKKLSSKGPRAS